MNRQPGTLAVARTAWRTPSDKLNAEIVRTSEPDVKTRLDVLSLEFAPDTRAEFARVLKAEVAMGQGGEGVRREGRLMRNVRSAIRASIKQE